MYGKKYLMVSEVSMTQFHKNKNGNTHTHARALSTLTMLVPSSSSVMSRESLCLLKLHAVPSSHVPSQHLR